MPQANMKQLHVSAPIIILFFSSLSLSFVPLHSHLIPCQDGSMSLWASQQNITRCKTLDALSAEIGWKYKNDTNNITVDILFGAELPSSPGWMAWGLNPDMPQMVGTRALIALRHSDGLLDLKAYQITADTKRGCSLRPTNSIDFQYQLRGLNYTSSTKFLAMSVALTLPSPLFNLFRLNHVWQVGPLREEDNDMVLVMHDKSLQNFDSSETINLATGRGKSFARHQRRLRKMHAALNIAAWGTILPMGIITARYFKIHPFKKDWWFKFHVAAQILSFMIGSIGWGLGIALGNTSKNYTFMTHRILGTTIFSVAILQMLAMCLKPKRTDEIRKYWHMYHHLLGYSLFVLIVVNIFRGTSMVTAERWKWAYVGILSCLGLIVLILEIITWYKFLKERFFKPEVRPLETKQEETTGPMSQKVLGQAPTSTDLSD